MQGKRDDEFTEEEPGKIFHELRFGEMSATREIPHALPAMTSPHPLLRPVQAPFRGVWVAGDHRDTSSIQGALVSGRRAAAAVTTDLGGTR